ncbi:glycosyl transferase, family I [Desulfosarcina variabilis str. Montpellier]|uniref:glycosyltransferase family 4 protein n=1 Tax=Desulfosarcina variabilis TaxID=2300 RepID=UPI003AFB0A81
MNPSGKKKICFLSYRKVQCTVVDNFSKAANNAGYDVTVIRLRGKGEKEYEIDGGRTFYKISLCNRFHTYHFFNRLIFLWKAILIINRNRYSIVQITSTCSFFILIRLLTFFYAKSIFQILSYPISSILRKSQRRMLGTAFQCYFLDKVAVQSEELKRNWIGLRKFSRAIVIPVGFNKDDFYPGSIAERSRMRARFGLREDQPVLVYCGAISHHRRIDYLIQAFKQVLDSQPDVKLLMVGYGVALSDIKALVKRMNIEEQVIFTGRVPYRYVRKLIAMADIGLSYIPVNYSYNYNPPLKTYEYMACGLATIATNTESNCKVIVDGYNGSIASDTPDDYAMAIKKLLTDKNLRTLIARNARNSILHYDFNYISKKYFLPLYDELLSSI